MSITKSQNARVMSEEAIQYLCKCINLVNSLPTSVIDNLHLADNLTFSSTKIDRLLTTLKEDCNKYTDSIIANFSRLELRVVTDEADMNEHNKLYLIKKAGETSYSQYVIVTNDSGVDEKILLGTTDINMSDYYTITQADIKFTLKTDFDALTTEVDKVKATLGTKVDKTDIVDNLTSTDTDKPLSANQGKVLKDEVNLKANDDDVIKKTDITTKIDSSSTDTQVPSALTVYNAIYNLVGLDKDENVLTIKKQSDENEGGEIRLEIPTKGCTLIGNITVDAYGDYMRFFEGGGTHRGCKINFSNMKSEVLNNICTTSVADIPRTQIKLNDGFTGTVIYEVKNGVCYVNIDTFKSEKTGQDLIVSETLLPKPSIGTVTSIVHFDRDEIKTGMVYLLSNTDNRLKMHCYKTNTLGWCTFSYPVAES